jgi:hypothetical protein
MSLVFFFLISILKFNSGFLKFILEICISFQEFCISNTRKIKPRKDLVLYTKGWVCDVALIGCTLSPGKSKRGWDFGREGTGGQWGTKGVSLQATWDWSGRFLSQLEGAK